MYIGCRDYVVCTWGVRNVLYTWGVVIMLYVQCHNYVVCTWGVVIMLYVHGVS